MFKELGSMLNLLRNQGKLQEEAQKFQAAVGNLTAEGSAGGGLVTVKVNGRFEVVSVRFSEDARRLNDFEMLEDLVAAATNQALAKARQLVAEETAKMAASLGLPAAFLGGSS